MAELGLQHAPADIPAFITYLGELRKWSRAYNLTGLKTDRDIVIKNETVEFKLPKKYGGKQLRLPIVAWKNVRSAEARDRRPVVMMEFCLGSKHIRTRVNLNDRSQVKYPFLVGRNALKKDFVVDCMKERCAPPICPEGKGN